ncbi:MAG: hypothetical protein ACP5F1_00960 [Thermoplasmata archaeon]|nr:hypothetical protein [Thermoplasmata archaeon]
MILARLYLSIYNTDLIYGEIKGAYNAMVKIKKISEKKNSKIYNGLKKFAEINIQALEGKITISQAKKELENLSVEFPEVFLLDRLGTGSVQRSLNGYIHRLEYSINRYDIKYPYFNMQRCDDL